MRITRPRSVSASIAFAPRRRGGMSPFAACLGTFLHLMTFILGCGSQRRSEPCDVARRRRRRRERQRQRDGHGGTFIDPALQGDLAGVHSDQALDNRKPEAGSLMPPLIGLAGLEERITDPLEIIGRDADPGIGDAKHQPRSLDAGGNRHRAAALGNLMALETRFSTICLNARGSPVMTGKSCGTRLTRSMALSRAFSASRLQQLSNAGRGANGSGEISKLPASIFDMSRMPLTTDSRCCPESLICWAYSLRRAASTINTSS